MRYNRIVVGYHGCDLDVATKLLDGEPFAPSTNDYDWLGSGIYFWEYGWDRAYRFAEDQVARGRFTTPAAIGALIQLGECFDLLDTWNTRALAGFFVDWEAKERANNLPLPVNSGKTPDKKLRRLDCAVINKYLQSTAEDGKKYDTVRGCFVEGDAVFPTSGIQLESHIQIAVRNPACIVGVFKPR